jgi:hypothetical protein
MMMINKRIFCVNKRGAEDLLLISGLTESPPIG